MADLVITEKEKLVEIANAIREKAGTSDAMAFDAMSEAIAAIDKGAIYTSGTITPAETITNSQSTPYTITHNLGAYPTVLIITRTKYVNYKTNNEIILLVASPSGEQCSFVDSSGFWWRSGNSNPLDGGWSSNYVLRGSTNTKVDVCGHSFISGCTYQWIAFSGVKL